MRSFLIISLSLLFFVLAYFINMNSFSLVKIKSEDISTIFYLSAFILPSNLFTIQQTLFFRANINNKKSHFSFLFLLSLLLIIIFYSFLVSPHANKYPILIFSSIHYLYNIGRLLIESIIFKNTSPYEFFDDLAHK